MTLASPVTRGGRKYAFPCIPRWCVMRQRFMEPCAGRIPRRFGSTGSPAENVRVKIPVIAQTIAEITNAAVVISPGFEIRAISMKTTATAKRRIAAMEYLFRIIGFISSPVYARLFLISLKHSYCHKVLQTLLHMLQSVISNWLFKNFISFMRDMCVVSWIFSFT